MDSRDILKVETHGGISMFLFKNGGASGASPLAIQLFEEVQALRYYGNKDCIAQADESLNKIRGK